MTPDAPPPRIVVSLPDSKTATYTFVPSPPTAIARGSSPSIAIRGGTAGNRLATSKISTVFACEHEMKARSGVPPNTTSQGSSSHLSVATTLRVERRTMLTLSETWLTTHTSSFVRARTETGSSPTGTLESGARPAPLGSTPSSRAPAVFTARSFEPSGVRSSGWTWGVSQFTKAPGDWAQTGETATRANTEELRIFCDFKTGILPGNE